MERAKEETDPHVQAKSTNVAERTEPSLSVKEWTETGSADGPHSPGQNGKALVVRPQLSALEKKALVGRERQLRESIQ